MQPYPGRRRGWAGCVLASLLLHLCCLWSVEQWLTQTSGEERVALQLESSSQPPFKPKERLALPPGKHAFAPRPSFRPAPRQPSDLIPGAGHGYLERGVAAGLESQTTSSAPTDDYSNADTLFAHRDWEHTVLQAWQDSVKELLARREPEKEDHALDPLAAALEAGRTMVELDPQTGEFVRAHWYLPVYGGKEECGRSG